MVTTLGGSREPAREPLSDAESRLPLAHWEDSWLSTRPGHLRTGAAPGEPDRLQESTLAWLPNHPTRTQTRRCTPPRGGGWEPAQSRAHHPCALCPAHLRSVPWSRGGDGRRHLGTQGGCGGAPHLFPFPRAVVRSLPSLPTSLHPSLSFPPPRLPRHRYLQSQPGAGEAAKGGREGSEG